MVSHAITMIVIKLKAYTYIEKGRFELLGKPRSEIADQSLPMIFLASSEEIGEKRLKVFPCLYSLLSMEFLNTKYL